MNLRIAVVLFSLTLAACGGADAPAKHGHDHGPGHTAAPAEAAKGPHRGRLLTDGDFQLELAIFESGVPPEFHAYATRNGEPIAPAAFKLTVTLTRLDGQVDRFTFTPENDYLKGSGTVVEPHSFDVQVTAEHAGKRHTWSYSSYEGRTTIAAERAKAQGIATAIAGPGVVRTVLSLYGSIQPDATRVRSAGARFPGVIQSVAKQLGDTVRAGETLAVVESNESLRTYAVTAPISGIITQRRANPGETAGQEPLFVIADFGQVWAELTLFARDRQQLRVGQSVAVKAVDGAQTGQGTIAFIAPASTAGNQSLVARVELDNSDGRWTPGLFVSGAVTVAETPAELVVPNSALQGFRDFTVVFAQVGDTYEVRMLELGDSDGEVTAVLGGLKPGTVYVTENSYLIKADIEKSGASHDH